MRRLLCPHGHTTNLFGKHGRQLKFYFREPQLFQHRIRLQMPFDQQSDVVIILTDYFDNRPTWILHESSDY